MIDAILMMLLSLAILMTVVGIYTIAEYLKGILQALRVIGSIMIEMKDKMEKK